MTANKKIIVCTPVFVRDSSLDYGYWNIILPLQKMSYDVLVYDYTKNEDFEEWIKDNSDGVEIILSIATGHEGEKYYKTFEKFKETNIQTVNWFCDDSWRYDDFSKKFCKYFKQIITTELTYVEKYENDGYKGKVHYATWPVDIDFFKFHHKVRNNTIAIYGGLTEYRESILRELITFNKSLFKTPSTTYYEDVVRLLGSSKICLNISDNRGTKQTKARIFEAAAAGCLILTEDYPDANIHFNDKEMIKFKTVEGLKKIITMILEKPSMIDYIAENSHKRFVENYEAKIVLNKLIQNIARDEK